MTTPPERSAYDTHRGNRQSSDHGRRYPVAAIALVIRSCATLSRAGRTTGKWLIVQAGDSAPCSFGFGAPQRFEDVGHEWSISVHCCA